MFVAGGTKVLFLHFALSCAIMHLLMPILRAVENVSRLYGMRVCSIAGVDLHYRKLESE